MKLLTFAHRKEASAFIEYFNLKSHPFFFDGVYKSEEYIALITGEGIQAATEKTTAILASYEEKIKQIFNIGVAGSVSSKYKKGMILQIRTFYAQKTDHIEFKSFTDSTGTPFADCMSLNERAIDINVRRNLSQFTDLIDREAWGVASASHLFKKKISSIKYISDDLESDFQCQIIIDEAEQMSKELLANFIENFTEIIPPVDTPASSILSDKSFYFTVTQIRNFEQLIETLAIKNIQLDKLEQLPYLLELKQREISPKERTKLLIVHLTELLNPFNKKVKNILTEYLKKFQDNNVTLNYDKHLETKKINFSFTAENQLELTQKVQILDNFSFKQIDKIFDGDFDV